MANEESACDMFIRRMKQKRASIPDPITNPTETVNDIFEFFEDLFNDFCGRFIPRSFFPNDDNGEKELLKKNKDSPVAIEVARQSPETESTLAENAIQSDTAGLVNDGRDECMNASTNSGGDGNKLTQKQQQNISGASTSKRSLPPPQAQAPQQQQQHAKRIKRSSVESQPPTIEVNDDDPSTDFKCPVTDCGQKCATQADLDMHTEFGHDWAQMYYCDEPGCGGMFRIMDYLFDHHRRMHSSGERPFNCTEEGCDCAFTDIFALEAHRHLHIVGLMNV